MRKTILIAMCLAMAGCKNPFDRTRDASGAGPTGTITASPDYVVFYNELVTGGGAFEYPGPDGQSLSFNDTSNPIGYRSIRYNWTGQLVVNTGCPAQSPSPFAGFDLQHAVNLADYGTQGRDLRPTAGGTGYTKVTFYARGSLSSKTVLKIEVASPGNPADACVAAPSPCLTLRSAGATDPDVCTGATPVSTLNSSWTPYTIAVSNSDLANVRDFFKATFVYTPPYGAPVGQGGTVYFDKIQYEP